MRWVGIDEAGYGPNLGPMVITAVVAETIGASCHAARAHPTLDFWGDLALTVDRAGGHPDRIWIDDSKAILHAGKGRDRLETACLAAFHAAHDQLPGCLADLVAILGAGSLAEIELNHWATPQTETRAWPDSATRTVLDALVTHRPLVPRLAPWRLVAIASVVVGPARFNGGLATHGSKAAVHFEAFDRLLKRIWDRASDGLATFVTGDKHGGRHYYLAPLSQAFPDAWIDRGPEGPELSQYTIRDADRRLNLSLMPRADRCNGLVALASIVSKTIRELWMDIFNEYWRGRIPGLRPTAGYPLDAVRFREAIEPVASAEGHDPAQWWRIK
jgi:hypothetical protein